MWCSLKNRYCHQFGGSATSSRARFESKKWNKLTTTTTKIKIHENRKGKSKIKKGKMWGPRKRRTKGEKKRENNNEINRPYWIVGGLWFIFERDRNVQSPGFGIASTKRSILWIVKWWYHTTSGIGPWSMKSLNHETISTIPYVYLYSYIL